MNEKLLLFNEIDEHLVKDEKPSVFLNELLKRDIFRNEYPFSMISDLEEVEQFKKYHPEGSVWNHTLMVVDEAAERKDKSENPRVLMWAALLHDVGKAPTTRIKNGKITSYNHEKWGQTMSEKFLSEFAKDDEFINGVKVIVRWHMEPLFVQKDLPFANINQMLKEVSLKEIALFSICDRLGRGNMSREKAEDEERGIEKFIDICRDYQEKNNKK